MTLRQAQDERGAERADVLAYLERRRDNAATIAARHSEHSELGDLARDRRRQLDIQIDELRAGMHLGAHDVRAALAAGADAVSPQMEIDDGGQAQA